MSNTEIVKEEDNEGSDMGSQGDRYNGADNRAFVTGLRDETNEKDDHVQSIDTLKNCVDSIDSHFKTVLATHE
jgi:hypothetical protein